MKPRRMLIIIHLPIRAVRLITDPVVDTVIWFIRPSLSHAARILASVWTTHATNEYGKTRLDQVWQHVSDWVARLGLLKGRSLNSPSDTLTPTTSLLFSRLTTGLPFVGQLIEKVSLSPVFDQRMESTGKVSSLATSLRTLWETAATGNTSNDQLFAITVGYITICAVAIFFLSSGIMFNGAAKIIRTIISQQLIVLKVPKTNPSFFSSHVSHCVVCTPRSPSSS